jgi:hypothetical protein
MATHAQITANQANAQLSTGPKTPEGRARVAQNRTTHGLAGRSVLIPGEDPRAFQTLLAKLTLELVPGNSAEQFLIERIAQAEWKLSRISAWESEIITEGLEGDPASPSRLMTLFSSNGDPAEALAKIHRYEAQLVRHLIGFRKELRLSKSGRHKASTTERGTTLNDINNLRETTRGALRDAGLALPPDDSNPISPPTAANSGEQEPKISEIMA